MELIQSASNCIAAWLHANALQPAASAQQEAIDSAYSTDESPPTAPLQERWSSPNATPLAAAAQQQTTDPVHSTDKAMSDLSLHEERLSPGAAQPAPAFQQQPIDPPNSTDEQLPWRFVAKERLSPYAAQPQPAAQQQPTDPINSTDHPSVDLSLQAESQQSGAHPSSSQSPSAYTGHDSSNSSGIASAISSTEPTSAYDPFMGSTQSLNPAQPLPEIARQGEDHLSQLASTTLHLAGFGDVPQAELPQPGTVIQPYVQPLGHDEQDPAVQHAQQAQHPFLEHEQAQQAQHPFLDHDAQQPTVAGASVSSQALDPAALGSSDLLEDLSLPGNPAAILLSQQGYFNSGDDDDAAESQPSGKKIVKAETIAFRESFAQAAASLVVGDMPLVTEGIQQRSDAWMAMRDSRLTASSFCNALGLAFWHASSITHPVCIPVCQRSPFWCGASSMKQP